MHKNLFGKLIDGNYVKITSKRVEDDCLITVEVEFYKDSTLKNYICSSTVNLYMFAYNAKTTPDATVLTEVINYINNFCLRGGSDFLYKASKIMNK